MFQKKLLICPLGCPAKRRKFSELKCLLDHLESLHGCGEEEVTVLDEQDGQDRCPDLRIDGAEFM